MHLQSLELLGFKSFADITLFNFHQGITAIVGPNGCGKSNLLDALRWVLGEQSAKSLRGGEMADVIFSGTDSRKPLGFAEVSLTLSDCGAELGVEWHDVRVTRRVYRDGNSEYFLNKTPCRLRDIQSLFADTGVARSAYSMMEQGKIDAILSSRPEDRRAVFEEAAGITKYKTQKREAMRKLEATEANLLRIGDVIKEVKRQIGSLQRQAGKARRYQTLLADLQVLDTHHSRKQLEKLEHELNSCRGAIERTNDDEQATRGKIENREADLGGRRNALDQLDAKIADARAEVERLQSDIGTNRSRIEFNRQRAEEIAELIARARNEIAAAEAKRDQQQAQMKDVNALIEKTAQLLDRKKQELARLTELTTKSREARDGRDSELQVLQVTLSKNESRISALADEISGINIRREATGERLRELDAAIAQAHDERTQAESSLSAAKAATENEKQNVDLLLAEMRTIEETLGQDRHLLVDAEKKLINLEGALAEKGSRLEVLKQLNAEGEGLMEGSQAVLKGLEDSARVQAALASQLDVDPKFVAAIEAALGRNLHAIVLQNAEAASEIVSAITEKKLGRAALLIPELNGAGVSKTNLLPKPALAWAIDKVNTAESLRPLLQALLRDVAIVTDLDEAIQFKKATPQHAVATLAGEFISIEGVLFGGVSDAKKESLLERRSRISILDSEFSMLTAQRETLRQKRDEAKAAVEKGNTHLEEARAKHRAADVAQSTAGNRIALIDREVAETARKIDNLLSEKTTLRQQIDAADDRVAQLGRDLANARKEFAVQEEQRDDAETARKEAIAHEEKAVAELNELRLGLATEEQRHENLVAQREPLAVRDAELNETIAARRADIAIYETRIASQGNESKAAEAGIEEQKALQEKRKVELATLTAQRAEHLSILQGIEADLRVVRDSLSELHERRAAEQVRETQLQMKIDNLAEHAQRRYHVDLRSFTPDALAFEKVLGVQLKAEKNADVDLAEVETIIADLTRRLDDMGPVNLDAVQEYDELEERHTFLETQNNDLTSARRELLDVIARINSTTKKLFAETFAQVRVNFREMFAELFGGGRADLSLMDENDPLNCGIEISAKPPGKQLQSVSLLSGGERTMTAVALLFAIYMVRPSPFCVLDELDAPLDESNINRFIRVLERFVAQSQFIIITHNKRTIAKADILYGITMEERGVSKLVGMKLTERRENEPVAVDAITSQRQFAMAENGNGHGESASFAAR
ncbi:MAG: chromosome segregation protein SMC [Spartobacteria bacterium]